MFRITTPLFYVNNKPHIGHLYSLFYADAINIWMNRHKKQSQLLTGTDEHGLKVYQSAILHNQTPIKYCDKISNLFVNMAKAFEIQPDINIRTTNKDHQLRVQQYWSQLVKENKIYQNKYSGWYCQSDENFLTDREVSNGMSSTGHPVDWVEENNYFLKPADIQGFVQLKSGKYSKEILGELHTLRDICLSRPKSRVPWGIPVPEDNDNSIYVWFDALLGYLHQIDQNENIKFYHVIGKDIMRFHMLHLPIIHKQLGLQHDLNFVVHNHWTFNNRKMSKSLNNVVCPIDLLGKYNSNAIRLMFLTNGPQNFDVPFNPADIATTYNQYISSFHNSIYRLLNPKIFKQTKSDFVITHPETLEKLSIVLDSVSQRYDSFDFTGGFIQLRKAFDILNQYISLQQPWQLDNPTNVLGQSILMARMILYHLKPILPSEVEKVSKQIGASVAKSESIEQTYEVSLENLNQFQRKKL